MGYNGSCLKGGRVPFGLAPSWKYPPDVSVNLKGLPQNEGRAASLDDRALLGTFEGVPISGCAGNSRILASWTSKRNSYHLVTKGRMHVTGGDPSSDVIPELDPQPDDYYIPKFSGAPSTRPLWICPYARAAPTRSSFPEGLPTWEWHPRFSPAGTWTTI